MDIRGIKILKENGHIGILTDFKDEEAVITWPNGQNETIKKERYKNVLVFDSAPAGYTYQGCLCDECPTVNGISPDIIGIRWKCNKCHNFDLCNLCYHAGKHNLEHDFTRMTARLGDETKVPARNDSMQIEYFGFYKNAVVIRGKDWSYGQQDGGPSKKGTVLHEVDFPDDCVRSGVAVQYENGRQKYRIGYEGKVDLTCVQVSSGGYCYDRHLPNLEEYRQIVALVKFVLVLKALLDTTDISSDNNNTDSRDEFLTGMDNNGNYAIHHAARNDNLEIVSYILQNTSVRNQKNNDGETALHLAVIKGKLDIAKVLIENDFEVNAVEKHNETAFHKACRHGHLPIVKLLLTVASLDIVAINTSGFNGFHLAISKGFLEIVRFILATFPGLISIETSNGLHALHIALIFGKFDVFRDLMTMCDDINVNVKSQATKETPLMKAVQKGASLTTIRLLLFNGAEIHHTDKNGSTCIHHALKRFADNIDGRQLENYSPTFSEILSEFNHDVVSGFVTACYILQESSNSSVFYQQHKQTIKRFCPNDTMLSLLEQFSRPHKEKRKSLPARISLPTNTGRSSPTNVSFHGDVRVRDQNMPQHTYHHPPQRSLSEQHRPSNVCHRCYHDSHVNNNRSIECRLKPCDHALLCNFHGSRARTCPCCNAIVKFIEPVIFSKKCFVCGTSKPDVVFSPCRHKIVCSSCSKNCDTCIICGNRVDSKIISGRRPTQHEDLTTSMNRMHIDEDLCPICFDRPKNSTFQCGHRHCIECARKLKNCSNKCSICKEEITQLIRLF